MDKRCNRCGLQKPITQEFWYFNKKTGRPSNATCKVCKSKYSAKRYIENKDQILTRTAAYQRENKDRQKVYWRRYKAKDPEAYAERRRRSAAKYRATPKGRLTNRVQSALWHALKDAGLGKTGRTVSLVGWTIDELKGHLEDLFEEGMGWHNAGEWHIDHIFPISTFDVTCADSEEFRSLWSLSNLAPLWAGDNIAKKAELGWTLPDTYKNPRLRAMYPMPLNIIEFFNVDREALKRMGYESISIASGTAPDGAATERAFFSL